MAKFKDFNRDQRFLLSPDLMDWVAEDHAAPSVIAAVERVKLNAFGSIDLGHPAAAPLRFSDAARKSRARARGQGAVER